VPCIPLDAFGLTDVDFLCLDVEGYELAALRGAEQTLHRCHPVVMLESKQLPHMDGKPEDAIRFLEGMRYRRVAQAHKDVVMAC
jgi:hypothetical protein